MNSITPHIPRVIAGVLAAGAVYQVAHQPYANEVHMAALFAFVTTVINWKPRKAEDAK